MSSDSGMFPHDGEGHGSCTGPGCDCDEKRYGRPGRGNNGSNFWKWSENLNCLKSLAELKASSETSGFGIRQYIVVE